VRETWWLIAQTSGAKIYWVLAMLMTSVITARYLGPAGRGVFVAAVGWVTLFATFGNLSLGQVIVHIATLSPKEEWLPRVIGSTIAILATITVLSWAIAGAVYLASDGRIFRHLPAGVLFIAFAALPAMLWIENANGILMAVGRLPVMNLAQTSGATVMLVLTFVALAIAGLHVQGALVAVLIAHVVTCALSAGYLLRRTGALIVIRDTIRELLGGGARLHLNALGTYLFTQANVLILNHYRTPGETAYYQLAVQLMTGLQIIPLAVSAVAYSLVAKLGPDAAWPGQRRLMAQVLLLTGAVAAGAWFIAPPAVRVIFGQEFLPTVPLFRILLGGALGMTLSIVMASQWIARGLFLQAAVVTLAIGAVTVVVNFLVVPRYGTGGAAWVTVGTYLVTMAVNLVMAVWVDRRTRAAALSA
jgi:O-antigen/teichoic acid export membrane protein